MIVTALLSAILVSFSGVGVAVALTLGALPRGVAVRLYDTLGVVACSLLFVRVTIHGLRDLQRRNPP